MLQRTAGAGHRECGGLRLPGEVTGAAALATIDSNETQRNHHKSQQGNAAYPLAQSCQAHDRQKENGEREAGWETAKHGIC